MSKDLDRMRYEYALSRVEALLPLAGEGMPADDPVAMELAIMSDFVIAYEKEHYPIAKPSPVIFHQTRQSVTGAQL